LAAHLVGNHEDELVALARRDERQAQARVPGGRLDDRAAGLQRPVALGLLDHREPDAVLDGAARVLALELEEQPAWAGIEPRGLDHRRVADEREDRVVLRHDQSVTAPVLASLTSFAYFPSTPLA